MRFAAGLVIVAVALAGCGGSVATHTVSDRAGAIHPAGARHQGETVPVLLGAASRSGPTGFVPAVVWRGQTAAWIARSGAGVALMSFNQRLVGLALHSGTVDAGSSGWRFGPSVGGHERARLIAAFNGGFKLDTGSGGFMAGRRVAVPLRAGLASIVTYADGYTDIGAWHRQLPAAGRPVASVRQNLTLLIDHGAAAGTADCVSCWGATLGGVPNPARSALGITARGNLIWAGGEHLTVSQLVDTLLAARVLRAVELDINPEWVAGYFYRHRHGSTVSRVQVVPGQTGIPGSFLTPYSRDFFTVVAR